MGLWFDNIETLGKYQIMTIAEIAKRYHGHRYQKIHLTHHKIEKLPTIKIWVHKPRICKQILSTAQIHLI